MRKISVVVPIYNEEEVIIQFLKKKLIPVLNKIDEYGIELILINDGSSDGTLSVLQQYLDDKNSILNKNDLMKVKLISLSRNFGKESALSAGIACAIGDAVLMIDADGQHPPKIILDLIKKWEDGAQIATGVRSKFTKHGFIQRLGSKMFYKILHSTGNRSTVAGATDFRIIDRAVVDEFNKLSEHNRITRGLIDWLGFEQQYIEYECEARMAGKPSYSIRKLFKLAVNSFISLSIAPLMIFGYIGAFIATGSFILGMFVIIQQYILGDPMGLEWGGMIQMAIFIAFLAGLILVSQAVTALYVSHIHAEAQKRPLYIIDKKQSRNL